MQKNLTAKTLLIIGVLLVFLFGIFFGTDPARSIQAMKEKGVLAGIQQNIHLGLDLRGGTHLILQVMVKDAVNATTDQAVERLQEEFGKMGVTNANVAKPDPANTPQRIAVSAVPLDKQSAARSMFDDKFGREYDISSTDNGYTLTLKPGVQRDLEHGAVTQAIETIRSRVDSLGVSEPLIQEHGLGAVDLGAGLDQLLSLDDCHAFLLRRAGPRPRRRNSRKRQTAIVGERRREGQEWRPAGRSGRDVTSGQLAPIEAPMKSPVSVRPTQAWRTSDLDAG